MKGLLIISAGPMGREIYHMAVTVAWSNPGSDWVVKGFLDDRRDILEGTKCDAPIVSSVEEYEPESDDLFTCAIASPAAKKKYAGIIRAKGGKFKNLISLSAMVTHRRVPSRRKALTFLADTRAAKFFPLFRSAILAGCIRWAFNALFDNAGHLQRTKLFDQGGIGSFPDDAVGIQPLVALKAYYEGCEILIETISLG